MQKEKLFTEISGEHVKKFLVIKGAYGAKSNGEALERLIDVQYPTVVRSLKTK